MKLYRVLIWGTGNWARLLLGQLPENCRIEAFVESVKSKEEFLGIPVISKDEYLCWYKKTDFTIVSVCHSEEIAETIKAIIPNGRNVFIMTSNCTIATPLDGRGWLSVKDIFNDAVYNARQQMYTASYVICDVNDKCKFLINSKYRMFLNGLAAGYIHQKEDIEKYFDLCERYYGINRDTTGYFLDIGANIGTTSIYVNKNINSQLCIVAFEMERENCKQLLCNKILNEISDEQMIIVEMGLSDRSGLEECMLSIREDNMADHRVVRNGNYQKGWKCESIKTIRLDDWIDSNSIDRSLIKYIWMDVQAHEGFVIDGGIKTFRDYNIPLVMEFWPKELKRNKSYDLLLMRLEECYKGFVCLQDITETQRKLSVIGELDDSKQYDIFLIK